MLLAGAYDCLRLLVGLSRRPEAERDSELLLLRHELSLLRRSVKKPRLCEPCARWVGLSPHGAARTCSSSIRRKRSRHRSHPR